jgi:hypothetical protein
MNKQEFIKKHNLNEPQFLGKEEIKGGLDLGSLTSIPEGFNPTVGRYLDLGSLTSIPEGFNPTVGGDLYLGSLTSIPEGFNPTVGGYLDLRSLTSIPEGFNPTVGGDLHLGSLTSIPEGFNPTVGGYLHLRSKRIESKNKPKRPIKTGKNKLLFWQDGKYVSADRILTEVIHKRGNVYRVRKIHSTKEFYLVTNGETHAHGETLKQAKADFEFKLIAERLKKDPIKEDTIITIQYYRIVTGACEMGVRNWINSVFTGKDKDHVLLSGIKAKDLLPLLEKNNAYGYEKFKSLMTNT